MPEDLESILRRVASGELSPDDAEPLVAAATADEHDADRTRAAMGTDPR